MLQQDEPDDFVIATGETNTVRRCVEVAFDQAGIPLGGPRRHRRRVQAPRRGGPARRRLRQGRAAARLEARDGLRAADPPHGRRRPEAARRLVVVAGAGSAADGGSERGDQIAAASAGSDQQQQRERLALGQQDAREAWRGPRGFSCCSPLTPPRLGAAARRAGAGPPDAADARRLTPRRSSRRPLPASAISPPEAAGATAVPAPAPSGAGASQRPRAATLQPAHAAALDPPHRALAALDAPRGLRRPSGRPARPARARSSSTRGVEPREAWSRQPAQAPHGAAELPRAPGGAAGAARWRRQAASRRASRRRSRAARTPGPLVTPADGAWTARRRAGSARWRARPPGPERPTARAVRRPARRGTVTAGGGAPGRRTGSEPAPREAGPAAREPTTVGTGGSGVSADRARRRARVPTTASTSPTRRSTDTRAASVAALPTSCDARSKPTEGPAQWTVIRWVVSTTDRVGVRRACRA